MLVVHGRAARLQVDALQVRRQEARVPLPSGDRLTPRRFQQIGLGFYRSTYDDDQVVVQAELLAEVGEGESTRVRVIETYTDEERYYMDGDELVWDRSLGRPYNTVKLPPGWMLTSVSIPAVISTDADGLVSMRFINPRNDSIGVVIRARRRRQGVHMWRFRVHLRLRLILLTQDGE